MLLDIIKVLLLLAIFASFKEYPYLILIPIAYIGYKKYSSDKAKKAEEEHSKAVLQQEAAKLHHIVNHIQEYLKPFTTSWQNWPSKVILTNYDYASFRSLLLHDHNLDASTYSDPEFKRIVDAQVFVLGYKLFKTSFERSEEEFKAKYGTQPFDQTFLIKVYYDTFKMNKTYISYFEEYTREKGLYMNQDMILRNLEKLNTIVGVHHRAKAIKEAAASGKAIAKFIDIKYVDKLDGVSFEHVLKGLYEQMGYDVSLTKASGDQGADLLVSRAGEQRIVQAKCYSKDLGNSPIQEAVAAKAFYHYQQATVVSNRGYTKGARELAEANDVELIDRETLSNWLKTYPLPQGFEKGNF